MNVQVCASGCLWLCHQSRLADLRTESLYEIWSTPLRYASYHLRRQHEGIYFSLWAYSSVLFIIPSNGSLWRADSVNGWVYLWSFVWTHIRSITIIERTGSILLREVVIHQCSTTRNFAHLFGRLLSSELTWFWHALQMNHIGRIDLNSFQILVKLNISQYFCFCSTIVYHKIMACNRSYWPLNTFHKINVSVSLFTC